MQARKRSTAATRALVPRTKSSDVGRGTDAPSSWGLGDGQRVPWEYAPAPESRDVVQLKSRYGLFIGGKEVAPRSGQWFTTIDPATEEPLAEVARANIEDVNQAVAVARRAFKRDWGDLPGRERAKYLFRIARILQERSREFAVLESLDGGKPIKESRDVDVPLGGVPLLVLRRLGGQARVRVPEHGPQTLGRGGAGHPVELPAADARVEDCARARGRQHGRSQASLIDSIERAVLRRRVPPGRSAAGGGQHHHRPGRDRAGPRQASGCRQGGLHRLDVRRQGDRARTRRLRQGTHSRTRWQGGQHHL